MVSFFYFMFFFNSSLIFLKNNNISLIGDIDTSSEPKELPTQCFGLGNERMKKRTPPGASAAVTVRMNVDECKKECRDSKECNIWQAHSDRGCYYSAVKDVFCEPYKGRYTGGRRKCNDKCKKYA